MPFKSKAQIRKFGELVKQGKISKREFNLWLRDTPDIKHLPKRLTPKVNKKRRTRRK